MFPRFRRSIILALFFALVFVIPAYAGGWAVITLDELPSNVVAGESLTIGFTVLQHGRTPMDGLYPTITANLYKEQEFVVNAEPDGEPGHYNATLTFPKEGEWRWSIQAFSMDQPMPMLSVAPAGSAISPAVTNTQLARPELSPIMLVSGIVLAAGLVGAVISLRRRSRPAVALTAISLLAGVALLIVGATQASEAEAQANPAFEEATYGADPQVELGRDLFVAKGCITCHVNTRAGSPSEHWTIEAGPDLSKFSANPEIIYMRLKDPSSVKSDTQMPQLGLKKYEIEALVAFINSR